MICSRSARCFITYPPHKSQPWTGRHLGYRGRDGRARISPIHFRSLRSQMRKLRFLVNIQAPTTARSIHSNANTYIHFYTLTTYNSPRWSRCTQLPVAKLAPTTYVLSFDAAARGSCSNPARTRVQSIDQSAHETGNCANHCVL